MQYRLAFCALFVWSACSKDPVPNTAQPAVHLLDALPSDAIVSGGIPIADADALVYALPAPVSLTGGGGTQWIDVPVTGGVAYRVQARLQVQDLVLGAQSVGASLEIEELDAAGDRLMHHNHLPRFRGSQDDVEVKASVSARGQTTILRLHLHPGGPEVSGKVQFQAVTVHQVPNIRRTLGAVRWAGDDRLRQVELREDTRPALVLVPGSEVVFDHSVAPPTTLRFGLARADGVPGRVCVSVTQGAEELASQCTKKARWTDISVPLTQAGAIHFSTRGPQGSVGLISDPRVIPAGRRPGPNVVVITLDTLRADALSVYGAQRSASTLDALAEKSVVFDHAFSVSGWTAPSLASMVTSTMPAEHGAGTRVPREVAQTRESTSQIRKNQLNYRGMKATGLTSMAEVFRTAGYQTVGFYTNYFFSDALGFARGFGRYHRFKGAAWKGGAPGVEMLRDWLGERKSEGPFFISLHFVDPHTPYHLRRDITPDLWPHHPDVPDIEVREEQGVAKFPRFQPKTRKHFEHVRPFYESEVAYLDGLLAQIFEMLDGLENTVVVVASDHGEAFKEHGLLIHGNSMYQELLHIPLIVKLPGGAQGGTRVDTAVSIMDVAPTVVKLAGLEVPAGWQGVDLLQPTGDRTLLMEGVYSGADQFAAVAWPHKLIWRPAERHVGFAVRKKAGLKLYDLSVDPGEKKNLQKKLPEVLGRLKEALEAHVARTVGWHLRCTPGEVPQTLTIQSTGPIGQVADFALEEADLSLLSADGKTLTLTVGFSEENDLQDWIAIRSRLSDFQVSAPGVPVVSGPTTPEAGQCVLWENALDADDLGDKVGAKGMEELKALGYVE